MRSQEMAAIVKAFTGIHDAVGHSALCILLTSSHLVTSQPTRLHVDLGTAVENVVLPT
jgi:hypothetical protein